MSFSDLFSRKAAGRHVTSDGDEEWYDDQENLHRGDDLPAQTDSHGGRAWFQHGQLHRDHDKPAIEAASGDKAWYLNNVLSRATGPAIVYADKTKEPEYWLDGQPMTDTQRATIDPAFHTAQLAKMAAAEADGVRNGTQQPTRIMKRLSLRH